MNDFLRKIGFVPTPNMNADFKYFVYKLKNGTSVVYRKSDRFDDILYVESMSGEAPIKNKPTEDFIENFIHLIDAA